MLSRAVLVIAIILVAVTDALAQTGQSNSQILHAILAEIRAIHEEVKTTATSQIFLTELELQQSVVNRATQHVQEEEANLNQLREQQKYQGDKLKHAKDQLDQATDPQQVKDLSDKLAELKINISALEAAEQDRSTNLQTAQQQLRDAQDSLDEIENQLSSIVTRLNSSTN